MKKYIRSLLLLSIIFGAASDIAAHTGHGHAGGSFSLMHYLIEPLHVSIGIVLVLVVAASIFWIKCYMSKALQAEKSKIKRPGL